MSSFFPLIVTVVIIFLVLVVAGESGVRERKKQNELDAQEEEAMARMTPEERAAYVKKYQEMHAGNLQKNLFGPINEQLICPHCQTKGVVRNSRGESVSNTRTKAGAFALTVAKSTSSRTVTKFHCDNCQVNWEVA